MGYLEGMLGFCRRLQDVAKKVPSGVQDVPKSPEVGPNEGQQHPSWAQEGSKLGPSSVQEAPSEVKN